MNNKSIKMYRGTTMGAVHTLLALFVLGMIANLFVEMPESITGQAAWSWVFGNSAIIVAHIILGTLLVVTALASLIMAVRTHTKSAVIASVFGLLFTLVAYYFGSEFVSAGQTNISSLLMAFGFLGALISYTAGVMKINRS